MLLACVPIAFEGNTMKFACVMHDIAFMNTFISCYTRGGEGWGGISRPAVVYSVWNLFLLKKKNPYLLLRILNWLYVILGNKLLRSQEEKVFKFSCTFKAIKKKMKLNLQNNLLAKHVIRDCRTSTSVMFIHVYVLLSLDLTQSCWSSPNHSHVVLNEQLYITGGGGLVHSSESLP